MYKTQLRQRRAQHIHLKSLWRTSLVSEACYDFHIASARSIGKQLFGLFPEATVIQIPIELCHEEADDLDDLDDRDDLDDMSDTLPEDFINSVDGILLTDYLEDEVADDPDAVEIARDTGYLDIPLADVVCMAADLPV